MILPPEYFENKEEQAKIKEALLKAIPEGVFYHNLIVVLSELLRDMTITAFKNRVYKSSVKKRESRRKNDN